MYNLVFTAVAEDAYKKIYFSNREHFNRITNALEDLKIDPWEGKPLKFKLKGQYSLRVGLYRILYIIEKQKVTVVVLDIGHRKDIYKR